MFFEPTRINIGTMNIMNADHLGTISFGSTLQANKFVAAKKTQGIGQQLADRTLRYATISMVLDDDLLDQFSHKATKRKWPGGVNDDGSSSPHCDQYQYY